MKVLHLTSGNLFGGIETYLLTLARLRHLCPEMEPQLGVCFPGRLRDELTAAGVPVHDLGPVRVSRPWTVLRARRRLKHLLREQRFPVVVTHGTWPHAIFAPVVKPAGLRLVNAVHGELTGRHWLDRWAARTPPDLVIANSHFTADKARSVFPDSPVEVIYPPFVPAEPCDRAAVREKVRASLDCQSDVVVIIVVSRMEELKGHAILIDALGRLEDVCKWTCWVVGGAQRPHEATLLADLQLMARRLGISDRVRFLGSRSDVPSVMIAADIYCQPNTRPEGFGLTFIEALNAGLPLVTSNIGGAKEIVTGACGYLCPPSDSAAVAEALRELIADPAIRQRMSLAGPPRAAEHFDPSRQYNRLSVVLRRQEGMLV